ncbi:MULTISPECIES: fumarylacetoacetate hydrolase family protein [Virgibacillus]|uniref:Homoprotocatechuate catabolism bifunctional isomerase/decarboxylase n=2 Tax=Virgibacillus TaxID=84406 RepID=A0A024QE57_9BACI|nr:MULTISPECIES: fumarylacetoacetate hydrolase family protein [Virgibacillus]EQB36790.1 2-hydroxyhepta-2,4-diene-1,7-dioate isomerase [Virgibacillus sp. CM-4]MYL42613.1 2-hydroxyhepta-2,4-diene-1,7-dioate isomerase [Virgibacillus massiliensis]GGJ73651.1 fumarylacetoacetate (FAA) hydrolase [Virgibacillus kapii]CDQ40497.1 Homoprotocatechuate catabolism bifunctional isomerase/decarboxylase [Virgibacillus massiliensis]
MKHARIAYQGLAQEAIVTEAGIQLNDGRFVNKDEVVWLPPVEPKTIFTLGLNYADHAKELSFSATQKEPLIFFKGPNTLIGHNAQTMRPSDVTFMHYECELAVIIAREANQVSKEAAYDYVKGYTIANDYALRDYLENYYRPNLRVKNRDGCTPIGPWFVDKEDVKDPMNLTLRTYVNGKKTQEGTTADMLLGIPELIEFLSGFMTLHPGDIILTGTPKGSVDTKIGDEVVTEIEGIGRLVNTIVGENTFQTN